MLSDSKHAQKDCVDNSESDDSCIYVTSADHTKLLDFDKSFGADLTIQALIQESRAEELTDADVDCQAAIQKFSVPIQTVRSAQRSCTLGVSDHRGSSHGIANFEADSKNSDSIAHRKSIASGDDVETLLSLSSTKERESKKLGEELLELLSKPTAKEKNLLESFRSADGYRVQEFCPKGTKDECKRANKVTYACDRLHFKKIIARHTEEQLGDCSFLNTCFHMDSCKYVHYKVDYDNEQQFKRPHPADAIIGTTDRSSANTNQYSPGFTTAPNQCANQKQLAISDLSSQKSHVDIVTNLLPTQSTSKDNQLDIPPIDFIKRKRFKTVLHPPQWIQCDLRFFDMSLLGKFSVVMADPPWDIHMELPYGTMSDDEMRKLNIPALQDDGVIFLWVTGRAMELGRECLALWGYERCDEIIWVKTNQLQRIIRTGRTGHWLNHGKEHCLVGVKGNPKDINRGLDCDVIVAEVRATSHKPDEIYGIIERLSPGTRKIELFGRAHNVQPNWITLGNQLNGVQLIEPDLVSAFKNLYKG